MGLVSLYNGIPVGPPEALTRATTKVLRVYKKAMMVLRNLRKPTPRESALVGAKPSQRTVLHPFDSVYPFQERFMASFPTPSSWVGQGEVMRHILTLDKCRSRSNESFLVEHTPILPARGAVCFPLQVFADMAVWKTWARQATLDFFNTPDIGRSPLPIGLASVMPSTYGPDLARVTCLRPELPSATGTLGSLCVRRLLCVPSFPG